MSLPEEYFQYPHRRHGMDHDLYPWSNIQNRKAVFWPNKKKIALWITVALEYFPLTPNDGPFRAPGHMVTPYPDYRTYTTRDYGNRVGIFRIMKVLDALGLKASAPMSSEIATRYPALLNAVVKRDWEIVGHGKDMNHIHYGGLEKKVEAEQIKECLATLRGASGQNVSGWLSPARSESNNTLELLVENNIGYGCDWVNDDMPYSMNTPAGSLLAMPHTMELEDWHLMVSLGQNEETYAEQVMEAFKFLTSEAETSGGRILHLSLTPYVIGQPFRIHILKRILSKLVESGEIWNATGAEIAQQWRNQQ